MQAKVYGGDCGGVLLGYAIAAGTIVLLIGLAMWWYAGPFPADHVARGAVVAIVALGVLTCAYLMVRRARSSTTDRRNAAEAFEVVGETESDEVAAATTTPPVCTGEGWNVQWAGETLPTSLTWSQIKQVWEEANPEDASLACEAVGLAAGEGITTEAGTHTPSKGVLVDVHGMTVDPASGEFPHGMWQALPSWYLKSGKFASKVLRDMPYDFTRRVKKDPCKQAYLTNRIRKAHCYDSSGRHTAWSGGAITTAPSFCNGGWTGNLHAGAGGQTTADQPPYYCRNPHYRAFCNSGVCPAHCSIHQSCSDGGGGASGPTTSPPPADSPPLASGSPPPAGSPPVPPPPPTTVASAQPSHESMDQCIDRCIDTHINRDGANRAA